MAPESKANALAIAQAALEKKADDVLVLDVAKLTSVADYLILCSGETERHVKAIADHIDQTLSGRRHPPLSMEGASTAQWILIDFGDVVAHIFRSDIRAHYGLEHLWADARQVRLPATLQTPAVSPLPAAKPRTRRVRKQG
ncbi:MAG: ribosome silencing factor [Nitrospirae bacterium]|nr:MAG: ribosome silencing factor [Nitrospirota bacterium]